MTTKLFPKFLFFLLNIFFASCTLYKPSSLNTPILEEKNQLVFGAAGFRTLDLNAAYSLTNNIAFLGSASYAFPTNYDDSTSNGKKLDFYVENFKFETGLAWFKHFEESNSNLLVSASTSFGQMGAKLDSAPPYTTILGFDFYEPYSADIRGIHLQLNYFVDIGGYLHLGMIGRLSQLQFSNFNFLDAVPEPKFGRPSFIKTDLYQLGLELRYTYDNVGVYMQPSLAFPTHRTEYLSVRRLNIRWGICFRPKFNSRNK